MNNLALNVTLANYLGITIDSIEDTTIYGHIKRPGCVNVTGLIDFTKDPSLLLQAIFKLHNQNSSVTYPMFLLQMAEELAAKVESNENRTS